MSRSVFSVTFGLATVFLAASLASAQSPVLSTDSVSPQNGSGGSQVFTFVFSDSNGYQGLDGHILISNGGSSGTDLCWVQFAQSGVELAPDDLSGAWPGVAYGSSSSVQNSQCAINGTGSSFSGSGESATLNLSVTFRVAFAGMKTIYTDINNSNGYAAVGTYNVTATSPDFNFSVSPFSQSVQAGQGTTYTVTATAVNGFNQDITLSTNLPSGVSGSFNPSVIAGGSGSSTLTLTTSPSAPGYNGPIQVAGTSASITHYATTQLTVTAAAPPPPPTLSTDSVSPQNGSGSSQVFTFVFTDSNGYQNLDGHILINSSASGTNSCWVQFWQNGIELAPDNASGAWPSIAYGSSSTLQNSQCAINGAGSSFSGSGANATLTLSVSFRAAYAGTKNIYTDINSSNNYVAVGTYDVTGTAPDFTFSISPPSQSINAGQSTTYTVTASPLNGFNQNITLSVSLPSGVSGSFNPPTITGGAGSSTLTVTASPSAPSFNGTFQVTGTSSSITHYATAQLAVTAAAPPPPPTRTTDSVSPQNGSGGSQVFTFVFSDSAGYQNILAGSHILISNGGSSGTDLCWVLFGSNGVALAPDDLNGAWPVVAYGSSSSVQNSQCAINGAGTTYSGSGDSLTLNLSVTFRAAFAGMKNIYTDVNSSNGYIAVGTYNVTASSPDFTLTTTPSSQTVAAGQSVTYTVTATPVNGFSQNITLATSAMPQGTSASFNPSVIVGGSGTSTLTMTASPTAPSTSDGQIWLSGTAASASHTDVVNLTVSGAPPPPPPTLSTDSVSPQNGSGSSQVFTFMFSDSAGYQDLLSSKYHVLINSAPSGTSSCWVFLMSTGLSLAPDDPSQPWPFVAYGSSNTAQNSQCMVNGVGTNISGSGNSLTLSLSLTFTAAYDGTKNVYTDVNASAPNYVAVTTYTIE